MINPEDSFEPPTMGQGKKKFEFSVKSHKIKFFLKNFDFSKKNYPIPVWDTQKMFDQFSHFCGNLI